ncbi:PREDICTED: piggyBac transposable element-derived protein 4-like [Eufriesea mexicana]|uniref:piggyBac transposable element-derived protein 4-like n=1 Tax=Eufriesea mexicana TaxID=516756 RepID=UPI00083C7663|nr:PREDICTED: piggyBac transposable element-derived protein 4-like [Eufriesea mexicana]
MSRRLRSANVLLERINDIDAECSEDDQEILDMENDNTENYDPFETDSNTDENEENISNVRRRRKRRRFLVSSDSENEEEASEIAMDGTVWQEVKIGSSPGRAPGHNIFRETSGPTGYSKRNITKGEVRTAFSVIIDKNIIELIRKCTEVEAFRVLGYKWELSTAKLYALFAIMYVRGAYEAKNIDIALLWNKKWGPPFFSNTTSRHDFTEIMRFIRFDDRNQRSQQLQTDKFAMISEVWYKFIDNSQNCYKPGPYITIDEQLFPTKARCRFTRYMPNKPDKFGIKFWLASDVRSKYIINSFRYLGKDESREPSVPLGEFVTMKLAEPYVGCGRNITTDNFFISLPLATKLLAKKTTIVGTIRANRTKVVANKLQDTNMWLKGPELNHTMEENHNEATITNDKTPFLREFNANHPKKTRPSRNIKNHNWMYENNSQIPTHQRGPITLQKVQVDPNNGPAHTAMRRIPYR